MNAFYDALADAASVLLVVLGALGLFAVVASVVNEIVQKRVDAKLEKRIAQEHIRSQHPSMWDGPRG